MSESKVSQGAILAGGAIAAFALAIATRLKSAARSEEKKEKTGWDDPSLMLMAPKEELDMSYLRPGLYQGSLAPTGTKLKDAGVDVVVLCAEKWQPPREEFEGVQVIRSAIPDSLRLSRGEIRLALRTSEKMADAIKEGKTVLSTCRAGMNRSSLHSAMTMLRLGEEPEEIVEKIRKARGPHALTEGGSSLFLDLIRAKIGIGDEPDAEKLAEIMKKARELREKLKKEKEAKALAEGLALGVAPSDDAKEG